MTVLTEPTLILEARQGAHRYPVHVGPGALEPLAGLVAPHDRVAVVSCARVARTPAGKRALSLLTKTGTSVRRAIRDAGLTADQVKGVVLVGGRRELKAAG